MVRTRSTTARLNAASNNEHGSGSANTTSVNATSANATSANTMSANTTSGNTTSAQPAVTGAGASAQVDQSSDSQTSQNRNQASEEQDKGSRSANVTSSPPAVLDAAEKDSQSSGSQEPQSRNQTPDENEKENRLAKITSSLPASDDGPTAAASEGESESEIDEDEEDEDEDDDAPIPDDAFDAVTKDEPPASKEKAEDDDEDGESELPLPADSLDKATKYQPYVPKESDNDQVPVPASLFERFQRAANRPSRKGAGPSSSSLLESEDDSEDIIVAPRQAQGKSTAAKDTPQPRSSKAGGASSDLSELGSTPEPVDPELVRLAGEEKRRKLELCQCEGWCTCERYNIFYGADSDLPSQTHLSERVLAGEELPESSMRSTVNSGKRSAAFDDERDGKKRRIEQEFSWERAGKPKRAPAGWVGGW